MNVDAEKKQYISDLARQVIIYYLVLAKKECTAIGDREINYFGEPTKVMLIILVNTKESVGALQNLLDCYKIGLFGESSYQYQYERQVVLAKVDEELLIQIEAYAENFELGL